MKIVPRLVIVAGIIFSQMTVTAEDFQGAEAVLKRLAAQSSAKPEQDEKENPIAELRKKIKAFSKDGQTLPAATAAAQWLTLYDTLVSIPPQTLYGNGGNDRLSVEDVIKALPPSAAWPALAEAINKRQEDGKVLRDGVLRILAAVLHGDGGARTAAIAALKQDFEKDKSLVGDTQEYLLASLDDLAGALDQLMGNEKEQVAAFEKKLAALEKNDEKARNRWGYSLDVPDLVRLTDKARASGLLQRALAAGAESVNITGKATQRLASQVALEHIQRLKKPVWNFVETIDDLPLYEALAKKFPKGAGQWERQRADQVYLLALLANDRAKDASKFVMSLLAEGDGEVSFALDMQALGGMQRQGVGKQVLAFLRDMLEHSPSLPFWRQYIEFSAREGTAAEALALLKSALQKPSLGPKEKLEINSHYADALLAADDVETGVKVLREMIQAGPQAGAVDAEAKAAEVKKQWSQLGVQITPAMIKSLVERQSGKRDSGHSNHFRLCVRLADLGRLLQRPEWIEEGVTAMLSSFANLPKDDNERLELLQQVVSTLQSLKRLQKAETLLVDELLLRASAPPAAGRNRGTQGSPRILSWLATLYLEAGRPDDVIRLFDQSPGWGAPNLSALATAIADDTPLLLTAARAFSQVNRKDEARRIVTSVVQDYPGKDAAYELLLSLGSDGLVKWLDEVYKGDRFEERPLIWKAVVLLQSGSLDEAEKTVRTAISVDPSDGEQGKGDRLRAYAVLADILEKKGDPEQAKIMRGAVTAIRISENADDWWEAGMLSRAVKMYEEALNHFADAYCIQSRLALRYSEMGDPEKAEQHYRRAFELMPESFGRVESHCFGCERAFSGEQAQSIADKVFSGLAIKLPDRPQVFYLLGYLREQQGRFADAATQYRKAVALDPDYLNTWNRLQGLEGEISLPASEREEIELALFRIDPLGHHSRPSLERVSDLSRVWDAILAAERTRPDREKGPLYPLAASASALDKLAAANDSPFQTQSNFFERREQVREIFVAHPLVKRLTQLFEQINQAR